MKLLGGNVYVKVVKIINSARTRHCFLILVQRRNVVYHRNEPVAIRSIGMF